jgi:peptide/nickel transport system ATP-binding protein
VSEQETAPVRPQTLFRAKDITKHFQTGRHTVHAVDGVSLHLDAGETLAIVGESGSGKSTLVRTLLRLVEPTSGSVYFHGTDVTAMKGRDLRAMRRHVQMIFQDPYASLHPRRSVADLISDPWRVHRDVVPRSGRRARVLELLTMVGLPEAYAELYPARLSGGERQRVAIARALALSPEVLILDEPVSALDVSIQAQVILLLMQLQQELGLAYVFISHDLALVRLLADRVAVMYQGTFVEEGVTAELFDAPRHDYTKLLLASSPAALDAPQTAIQGTDEGDR